MQLLLGQTAPNRLKKHFRGECGKCLQAVDKVPSQEALEVYEYFIAEHKVHQAKGKRAGRAELPKPPILGKRSREEAAASDASKRVRCTRSL